LSRLGFSFENHSVVFIIGIFHPEDFKMNRLLIAFLVFIVSAGMIRAQDPPPPPDYKGPVSKTPAGPAVPRQISGGVLNGKATSLPKPSYPPAARAVGASGAVSVQVLIDENGDVISAAAVSGHPLLRAAAVEAARGAKFAPTQLNGSPVKVSGVITYNFVAALSPSGLGFMVMFAERSGSFIYHTSPAALASQLPADWVEEKEILNSLSYEEPAIGEKPEPKPPAQPAPMEQKESNKQKFTIKGDINYSAASAGKPEKLDAKSIAAVANLHVMLEKRMAVNDRTAWNYEVGRALGALLVDAEDGSKLASHVAKIESIVERAPESVSQTTLSNLKTFLASARAGSTKDETPADLKYQVEQLANLRY
jgi:TonB family protein